MKTICMRQCRSGFSEPRGSGMGDSTASGTRSCYAQRPLTMRHSKSRAEPSTWASRVCDSEQRVHVARTENAGEASEGPEQTARSRSSRADANFSVSMSRRVRVEDIPEAKLWDSSAVPVKSARCQACSTIRDEMSEQAQRRGNA